MPRGIPKPKETMTDLLARYTAPERPKSKQEMDMERPKLRAAYGAFIKRKRVKVT